MDRTKIARCFLVRKKTNVFFVAFLVYFPLLRKLFCAFWCAFLSFESRALLWLWEFWFTGLFFFNLLVLVLMWVMNIAVMFVLVVDVVITCTEHRIQRTKDLRWRRCRRNIKGRSLLCCCSLPVLCPVLWSMDDMLFLPEPSSLLSSISQFFSQTLDHIEHRTNTNFSTWYTNTRPIKTWPITCEPSFCLPRKKRLALRTRWL